MEKKLKELLKSESSLKDQLNRKCSIIKNLVNTLNIKKEQNVNKIKLILFIICLMIILI